jgi:hypothetical protein
MQTTALLVITTPPLNNYQSPERDPLAPAARSAGRIAWDNLLPISVSVSATILQMSPDLLHRIGTALYGEHWHSGLAHDPGVPRRTVQRWAAGDAQPPPTLLRNLARLIAARQDELGKLYRELASR